MPEDTDILTFQFIEKMKGPGSLEDRLKVCKQVFSSYSIPMFNKEQVVLLELCRFAIESTKDQRTQVIRCLESCLKSKRMSNFSGDFDPEVIERLRLVLALHSNSPEESDEHTPGAIVGAAVALLDATYFQRWFACDVVNLCAILGHAFSAVSSSSFADAIKLLTLLTFINKNNIFKDETREAFLIETFKPLCKASMIVPDDEYGSLHSKIVDTFVKVILYNPSFLHEFCSKKHDVKNSEGELPSSHKFIALLKSTLKPEHKNTLKTCIRIFLISTIEALKKDPKHELVFDVFRTLCSVLGCKVDKMVSITWKPLKHWKHVDSYTIIADMIDILDQSEVPLSIDYGTFSLNTWFTSLVIGTLSINLTSLTPELLHMVESVFKYNPLIIENCAKCLAEVMVGQKMSKSLVPYASLMKAVLDGAFQVQRLQKLVSALLAHLKNAINARSSQENFENTTLEDIVPQLLSDHFSEIVIMMPNSQILSMFKDMLDHLQQDSLSMLEASCTDIAVTVMTEITSELLRQLLFSVKIADHSVPDNIKFKFNVLLEDLRGILEKMGNILVDDHHDRLLQSYLNVCHAFGAVQLMIEEYEGAPIRPVNKHDLAPFNFAYVHPYLTPLVWKRIGESITDHEGCSAHRSLCHLMVQKVEAVAQVEEGSEGPGTQTARRLLAISDPQWLWKEMTNLAPLFQANEVVRLIGTLVDSLGNQQDRWLELIRQDEFIENRRLVLALGMQLLNKMADLVLDEGNSLGRDVMAQIQIANLLEYELSLLITEDEGLAEEIEASIKAIKKALNDHLTVQVVDEKKKFVDISFVKVLHALPLHHFSVLSQNCISLATIAILLQLQHCPDVDNLLIDVLFRAVNNPNNHVGRALTTGLNAGTLVKFISLRGAEFGSLKPLVRRICDESLHDRKTAKRLIKAVSNPTLHDIWQTTCVIEAVYQLKTKKKKKTEEEEPATPAFDKDETLNTLVRLVVPIIENEPPSLELLPTYSTVLNLQLKLKNDFGSPSIRSKLEDYLRLCALDPVQGIGLIETVILFQSQLRNEGLQKTVALDGWKLLMRNSQHPKFQARVNSIVTSCSDEEFKLIMSDLNAEISSTVTNGADSKLGTLLEMWSSLVASMISHSKNKIRQEALEMLSKFLVVLIQRWKTEPGATSVCPVLKFVANLASATAVDLKPAVLDTFLVCLQRVPLPVNQPSLLLENLATAVDALFGLYLFRNALILDRLPVYLPIYKSYMDSLAKISHPESENLDKAIPCADKLERVAKTLVKRQRDFSRLAEFMIADVIAILERNPLHSEVKMKYTNVINAFLTICDEHAVTYLSSALPPASQELFKTLHWNFVQYHKYVGRI